MRLSSRSLVFGLLCATCVAVPAGYALLTRTAAPAVPAEPSLVADAAAVAGVRSRSHLLFRHTALDAHYGRLGVAALDHLERPRLITPLSCERVSAAAGRAVCLVADRGLMTTYRAEILDEALQPRQTIPFAGVPSRTRMAPDGRLAGMTYFVSGDSYASGGFSTRTLVMAPDSGQEPVNLEEFAVSRDGKPFKSVDFNFWGVTFARERGKFYATLSTGCTLYLIEGDALARTARVLREGIECPSLSPDNRRIAFKKRLPGVRLMWQINVLDLESGVETPLAETRSVDDQVEWLDDQTILYALPNYVQKANASMDIWAVPADGTGTPALFLRNADSPAVVRYAGSGS